MSHHITHDHLNKSNRMFTTLHPCMPRREPTKNHFTLEEDEKLKSLVMKYGDKDWRLISNHMSGRSSRQCRERYIGYLNPSLTFRPWTEEEDALLIQKLKEFGPKWTKMVPFFEGRSDCNIKNRWYKHLSKDAQPAFINSVFNRNERKAKEIPNLNSPSFVQNLNICYNSVPFIPKTKDTKVRKTKTSRTPKKSVKKQQNQNINMNQCWQYQCFQLQQNMFYNPFSCQMPQYPCFHSQQPMNISLQADIPIQGPKTEVFEVECAPFSNDDEIFDEFDQFLDEDEQTNEECF